MTKSSTWRFLVKTIVKIEFSVENIQKSSKWRFSTEYKIFKINYI